ncbi:hypothetical protein CLAIMM_06833, partial [Cladophialophora immunda]
MQLCELQNPVGITVTRPCVRRSNILGYVALLLRHRRLKRFVEKWEYAVAPQPTCFSGPSGGASLTNLLGESIWSNHRRTGYRFLGDTQISTAYLYLVKYGAGNAWDGTGPSTINFLRPFLFFGCNVSTGLLAVFRRRE